MLRVIKRTYKPAVSAGCASGGPLSDPEQALIVGSSRELLQKLGSQVQVRTGFITEREEQALLRELDPSLKKKRYEFDHWDDVSLKLSVPHLQPLKVKLRMSVRTNAVKRVFRLRRSSHTFTTHLLYHRKALSMGPHEKDENIRGLGQRTELSSAYNFLYFFKKMHYEALKRR